MEIRGRSVELVEEVVVVGRHRLAVLRPVDSEELIDEEAFEHEEFLPYWAELWPSARALAEVVAGEELAGCRVLELGCGLALPSLVAALGAAHVVATDWATDALGLVRDNARRNGVRIEVRRLSWSEPGWALEEAPWDLVLASDVLYEERNGELLLELLPALTGQVLLADPGRPYPQRFLDRAGAAWGVQQIGPLVRRLDVRESG